MFYFRLMKCSGKDPVLSQGSTKSPAFSTINRFFLGGEEYLLETLRLKNINISREHLSKCLCLKKSI